MSKFNIGDRVVYPVDRVGSVIWNGSLPTHVGAWTGVDLDSGEGNTTGYFKKTKLFSTPSGKKSAIIVRPFTLTKIDGKAPKREPVVKKPEPVAERKPEPVVEAEPVAKPATIVEPEPVAEPETITEEPDAQEAGAAVKEEPQAIDEPQAINEPMAGGGVPSVGGIEVELVESGGARRTENVPQPVDPAKKWERAELEVGGNESQPREKGDTWGTKAGPRDIGKADGWQAADYGVDLTQKGDYLAEKTTADAKKESEEERRARQKAGPRDIGKVDDKSGWSVTGSI